MRLTKLFSLVLLVLAINCQAQDNFQFTPAHPKAGDVITFTYEPSGDIANSKAPLEAIAYQMHSNGQIANDLSLTKSGRKYAGTIQTDTSANFIYFSFSSNEKFDNNFNNGYSIILLDGEKAKKGGHASQGIYYQYYGTYNSGMEKNPTSALKSFEKEFEMYPESKKGMFATYFTILSGEKKDEAAVVVQKEIEAALKDGLKEEADYAYMESLYRMAKSPQQQKFFATLKKEKFPNGTWAIGEKLNKYSAERDPAKKKEMLYAIKDKIATDSAWKNYRNSLANYYLDYANSYTTAKDWDGFKVAMAEAREYINKDQEASLYNNLAWAMQEDSTNLELAEKMSAFATEHTKKEWKNPTSQKPASLTNKQWERNRKSMYAMYADTYAMVNYRLGKYKKGLPYAKDAALVISEGKSADNNGTYALLAEKVLPAKEYKKQFEQFVKDGKATSDIKNMLKKVYVKEKKSEDGFDEYLTRLEKESQIKMMEELRKSMLNEVAPSFALYNLEGKKVDINELKGKVVVVDFWATWCGPCKASFPGMQKAVTKYKDDPNVKFIFVDTWERGEDKEKNAQDFITKNKYSFDVLMDNDDKVIGQFKVDGIPTKFIIDKEGKIRFRAVGFDGNDDKLVQELTAMIEMAAGASEKKAF